MVSSGFNFLWCYHQLQPSHVLSHAPLQLDDENAYVSSIINKHKQITLFWTCVIWYHTTNRFSVHQSVTHEPHTNVLIYPLLLLKSLNQASIDDISM